MHHVSAYAHGGGAISEAMASWRSWLWPWGADRGHAAEAGTHHDKAVPAAPVQAQATPSSAPAPAAPPAQQAKDPLDEVLAGHPTAVRAPFGSLFVVTAFGVGAVSGMVTGARKAGLVFLAENAHRLPDTVQGWYFYNKTKNYRMILGGVKHGASTGLTMSGWVAGWCLLDYLSMQGRHQLAVSLQAPARPDSVLDAWKLGHWTDGTLAGFATALIGAVSCTFLSL